MHKHFVIGFLLLSRLVVAAGTAAPSHVVNFGEVDSRLWRGAQPTVEALRELKESGVNLVIDLREHGIDTEKSLVETLGMKYRNVPLRSTTAPRQAEIEAILSLLQQNPNSKVFVHCWRGKDRTGTVVACYRIQYHNWDNRRALEEARSYGMSRLERAMQSYIMHFTPLTLPAALPPSN